MCVATVHRACIFSRPLIGRESSSQTRNFLPYSPSLRRAESSRENAYGYRALISMAIPLALTVGCFSITLFTDRTLLMWYGPVSSAASISAGNLYWTIACIPVSAIGFATPLVAMAMGQRRGGQRKQNRIWSIIWQTLWITVAILPILACFALAAPWLFAWFGHEANLASEETRYFRTLLLVAPASMLEAGLTSFFIGRRIVRPVLICNIAAAGLNVVLDFALIFGMEAFGHTLFPRLGVIGAALATSLAMWAKVVLFAILLLRLRSFRRHVGATWRPNPRMIGEILGPGLTLGLQQWVRSGVFSYVLIAIGVASVDGLAATSASFSLYQLLTIPVIGLATALTVLSGQSFAEGGPKAVRPVLLRGLNLGVAIAITLALLMVTIPRWLLSLSLHNLTPADHERIYPIAETLLTYMSLYALADITALLLGAVLKGMGRTSILLAATAVPGALALLSGHSFSGVEVQAVYQWWIIMIAWASLQSLLLCIALAARVSK